METFAVSKSLNLKSSPDDWSKHSNYYILNKIFALKHISMYVLVSSRATPVRHALSSSPRSTQQASWSNAMAQI